MGRTHRTWEGHLPNAEIDRLVASGVHSITGEVGSALNFDEVVTYDEASAVAAFLIVYTLS